MDRRGNLCSYWWIQMVSFEYLHIWSSIRHVGKATSGFCSMRCDVGTFTNKPSYTTLECLEVGMPAGGRPPSLPIMNVEKSEIWWLAVERWGIVWIGLGIDWQHNVHEHTWYSRLVRDYRSKERVLSGRPAGQWSLRQNWTLMSKSTRPVTRAYDRRSSNFQSSVQSLKFKPIRSRKTDKEPANRSIKSLSLSLSLW